MKRLIRSSLLLGCLAVAGFASRADAYPPQCMDRCDCSSSCATPCYLGTFRTTCDEWICVDYCRGSAPSAANQSPVEYTHGCSEAKPAPTTSAS